jgi:hypothetical protein
MQLYNLLSLARLHTLQYARRAADGQTDMTPLQGARQYASLMGAAGPGGALAEAGVKLPTDFDDVMSDLSDDDGLTPDEVSHPPMAQSAESCLQLSVLHAMRLGDAMLCDKECLQLPSHPQCDCPSFFSALNLAAAAP